MDEILSICHANIQIHWDTAKLKQNSAMFLYLYLYLFICHTITIITKKCQKNVGRNGEEA